MRFINYLIFLIICHSAVQAQDCKATIRLISDIDNVEYYINNNFAGVGSLISVQSETGKFYIEAREKGKMWDPAAIRDSIDITDCGEYKREFNFSTKGILVTNPPDVRVLRGDSLLGFTPLNISILNERLRLQKEGYQGLEINTSEINGIIKLQANGYINDKRFYEKSLFKYLIGGLLVFGGTTAYYKLKADEKYEQYELTGDNVFLKQTRKYDLISGIAFGAMQINLGFLLYYFLSE